MYYWIMVVGTSKSAASKVIALITIPLLELESNNMGV